jgi:hypothetical protein
MLTINTNASSTGKDVKLVRGMRRLGQVRQVGRVGWGENFELGDRRGTSFFTNWKIQHKLVEDFL